MADAAQIGRDLLNVPMGDMIRDMAFAIAEAQVKLDEASIHTAAFMGRNEIAFDNSTLSMIELGFTPTFYQFVDTVIEVKIAIKITREEIEETQELTESRDSPSFFRRIFRGSRASTTTVDATYSNTYSYSAEGSSLLRTKLAPVPPPKALEDRIQIMIDRLIADRNTD
jgi:hypothetical protein